MSTQRVQAFAVLCRDRSDIDTQAIRKQLLEAHLAYVESIKTQILVAGPVWASGSTSLADPITGSMLVLSAATESAARALLEGDPYFKADIWALVAIYPFLGAIGTWLTAGQAGEAGPEVGH
jgi:uncharacterized protein